MQKIKSEKGITLLVLVITIIVMVLISVPITLHMEDVTKMDKITKHKNDFVALQESVGQAFAASEEIYPDTKKQESLIGPRFSGNVNFDDKNVNDGNAYFVIDLNKLNARLQQKTGTTISALNFGSGNTKIDPAVTSANSTDDTYIINSQSRTIYYVKGFENSEGKTIHTMPSSYSDIKIKNYTK